MPPPCPARGCSQMPTASTTSVWRSRKARQGGSLTSASSSTRRRRRAWFAPQSSAAACPRSGCRPAKRLGLSDNRLPALPQRRARRDSLPHSASHPSSTFPLFNRRYAIVAADIVDDLQYALAERRVLHGKLGDEAAVVEQVGGVVRSGAGLIIKTDAGVGQVRTDDRGNLSQADGGAARIVDTMGRLIGQQYAGKHLGHIVHVDGAAHRVLEGQSDGIAAGWLGDDPHVIDRPAHLVRSRHIGHTDPGDAHAVFFAVIQRLPLVHYFVPGVLVFAMPRIVLAHGAPAVVRLLAVHRE